MTVRPTHGDLQWVGGLVIRFPPRYKYYTLCNLSLTQKAFQIVIEIRCLVVVNEVNYFVLIRIFFFLWVHLIPLGTSLCDRASLILS